MAAGREVRQVEALEPQRYQPAELSPRHIIVSDNRGITPMISVRSGILFLACWMSGAVLAQAEEQMSVAAAAGFACSSGSVTSPYLCGSSSNTNALPFPVSFPVSGPSSGGNKNAPTVCGGACLSVTFKGETEQQAIKNFEQSNNCVFLGQSCLAPSSLTVSKNYLNYELPTFEGDINHYYNDTNCICSAGVGHEVFYPPKSCPSSLSTIKTPPTCIPGRYGNGLLFPGKQVSKKQILDWENKDISTAVIEARILLHGQDVTQHEFDSVVDIIYTGGLSNYYTIGEDISKGQFKQAIAQNTLRDERNGVQPSRTEYQNSGLSEAAKCKLN
jgi:hypothetical protein